MTLQNPRKVIVLGSTGSIGIQALDVLRASTDKFKVVGLACNNSIDCVTQQAHEFLPEAIAIANNNSSMPVNNTTFKTYYSESGILEMIKNTEADIVVNSIAGANGLLPSYKALEYRRVLALANKETIVMAGNIIKNLAQKTNTKIIPIDSEHAAIFQLTRILPIQYIEELILTASGGPFLKLTIPELKKVKIQDALKHPTWKMGNKITIDSATMANKGLEIIEAQQLFNFDIKKIKVIIHPQSIVHSLIKSYDGCLYAQISKPDMRISIQNALTYPEILPNPFSTFDITDKDLTFIPVDLSKFKMLKIAYTIAEIGGVYPIIYNAANEIAVASFLQNKITFLQIPEIVQHILDFEWENYVVTIDEILYIDQQAREKTQVLINKRYTI